MVVRGRTGERRIAAADFFTGIYETALSPEELLIATELPVAPKNSTHFFHEFARRHGDYAITGVAAQATIEADRLTDLRLAFFAVGDRPVLAKAAAKLTGVAVTAQALREACRALREELDPHDDQQATAAMRRHLANVLLRRCMAALLGRPELATEQPA
jgi:carbon-monoxide dehydrogenase medium subunit